MSAGSRPSAECTAGDGPEPAGPAERLLTPCGSGHLVWHAWGPLQAEPVVLLHGGSGSWTHWWRNITPLVAAGRRVLVPDLPGCGDSARPDGAQDAQDLVAPLAQGLLDLVGPRGVDLVGFSFGGLTAGLWAAAEPAQVRRLVLVGAPGLGLPPPRPIELKGWRHLPAGPAQNAVHRHNLGVLMVADAACINEATLARHAHNVRRDRLPRRRLSRTDALAQALTRFEGPVSVIYGAWDALYCLRDLSPHTQVDAAATPVNATAAWAAVYERYRAHASGLTDWVLVPEAGHWVQFEAASVFNAALARCLGLYGG